MSYLLMAERERLAALEAKYEMLQDQFDTINGKLDNLIGLKNKGAGAFWVASALFGTSMLGALGTVLGWFRFHIGTS